jgi:hypothetical protein
MGQPTGAFRWNGGTCAHAVDALVKRIERISVVADDPDGQVRQAVEQTRRKRQFIYLARRESKSDGPSAPIGDYASRGAIATRAAGTALNGRVLWVNLAPCLGPLFFSASVALE